jgi:hypothetical protein
MPRTPQPRNVHQLATHLASMLTVHHLTPAHVVWDTAWPLAGVTQHVFLCVKVGAPMVNALLPMSAHATMVTPGTLTTELGTPVFLRAMEVAPTVTALPPTSVPVITVTLKIPTVTGVSHIVLQVAQMPPAQHQTPVPVSKVTPRWLILTMYVHLLAQMHV